MGQNYTKATRGYLYLRITHVRSPPPGFSVNSRPGEEQESNFPAEIGGNVSDN